MREADARQVLLVQAFDGASPPSPNWSADDRRWATRLALESMRAGAAAAPTDADFIVERARHALQRLGPREPELLRWLARPLWRAAWVFGAVLAGLLAGLAVDSVGSSQRINLLAPPTWGVLAWNLVVYGLIAVHAIAAWFAPNRMRPGRLRRLVQRAVAGGRRRIGHGAHERNAGTLQAFASRWIALGGALNTARAATLLHAAAAALGLGLVAGLYLRGLVLDYRAAWESTFLSAAAVHRVLAVLLAPAAALAAVVSPGFTLPQAAGFDALRAAHGAVDAGAPAAAWIHLLALTLVIGVVLPRTALAAWSAWRAGWLARHLPVPLAEPYFQQILRERQGAPARVVVLPYAMSLGAAAALGLRAVLARALGDTVELKLPPAIAFGAEDDAPADRSMFAGAALALAVFDLTATPEPEHHGRLLQRLADAAGPAVAVALVVDEAAFARRFGAAGARITERRAAWRAFSEPHRTLPVFVDLDAPDLAAAEAALRRALAAPARVAA